VEEKMASELDDLEADIRRLTAGATRKQAPF
jgi:hypothetical protein